MLKILAAVMTAAALFIMGWWQLRAIKNNSSSTPPRLVFDYEPICNDTSYPITESSYEVIEDPPSEDVEEQTAFAIANNFLVITDGQTLNSILRPMNVSEQEIMSLSLAFEPHLLAKDLAPGDFYRHTVIKTSNENSMVDKFIVRKLDQNRVPILYIAQRSSQDLSNPAFTVDVRAARITQDSAIVTMKVANTLYRTFNALPFGHELMQRLIGIFAWELRMPEGVLHGDQIEILVPKKFALGEFIGYGPIQSVYYRQAGRTLFAS